MAGNPTDRPPAVILGGGANALSVARCLGRRGITVYALNHPGEYVCASRFARRLELGGAGTGPAAWERFLVGAESDFLRGAVLLACSDEAIDIIVRHWDLLASKFRIEEGDSKGRQELLDKLTTYRHAEAAGIPTPRFWFVRSPAEIEARIDEFVFPLIVKPLFAPPFFDRFGKKYLTVERREDLAATYRKAADEGFDCVLMEFIPGADDKLCSYYTYMDDAGTPLVHFTKRIIRRFPANIGMGCYHVTDWDPEAAALGLAFFRHVGLRGLGNIEFKRDARDGRLKIIECNARFTAANCLVAASGIDLANLVYDRLTGRPPSPVPEFTRGLRLWYPVEDFKAFLELRRLGAITLAQWIASIAHRWMLPHFCWRDPLPTLRAEIRRLSRLAGKLFGPRGASLKGEQA